MKTLVLDDLVVGNAVTILRGPIETVMMPPMMLNGEAPPTIDTAVPGRIFLIEAIDMNNRLIMLKALDGGGRTETKLQQAGPLMALFPEQSKPDTYMYKIDEIAMAAVSQDWLTAYVRNFCAHKGGAGDVSGRTARKARRTDDSKVADAARISSEDGPAE
jgi:hypothetical protein